MCGIVGIVGTEPVNQRIYDALTVLQHRGQDAAGIVTYDKGHLSLRKSNGLVRDVFSTRHMMRLSGKAGIGHVRYPTAGSSSTAESQPFYVNSPYGISLAHNGNLTNSDELMAELFQADRRHINTSSDSEVLLNILAHELQLCNHLQLTPDDIFNAVAAVHSRCRGAYAAVAIINDHGMVCFRDPNGIRPAIFGKKVTEKGTEFMVASESVALDTLEFEVIRDIKPGEAIFVDFEGNIHSRQCAKNPKYSPCIFEYVYFARPDSIIDNVSVYKTRLKMGEKLAEKIVKEWPDHDIDVVIPIPDSSLTSAVALAHILGKKMRHGFVKNRYIGRTFIMPGQKMREKSVRQKLNAIDLEFGGKNVLLVDDSIVRGTTSQQIIKMARDAGAKKVYFASASPPVRHPNVYGIDMPSVDELVASGKTVEEIQQTIGADWLIFQELEDLLLTTRGGTQELTDFDASVFNGEYVTGDINQKYLTDLDNRRSDGAKSKQDSLFSDTAEPMAMIGLHNNN